MLNQLRKTLRSKRKNTAINNYHQYSCRCHQTASTTMHTPYSKVSAHLRAERLAWIRAHKVLPASVKHCQL